MDVVHARPPNVGSTREVPRPRSEAAGWVAGPCGAVAAACFGAGRERGAGAVTATTVEGAEQIIARGPAAAQIAIKQLGTNGGGFFGVNSAHPFENPTIASNLAQSLSILLIPVAFCFLFGQMAGDRRQG